MPPIDFAKLRSMLDRSAYKGVERVRFDLASTGINQFSASVTSTSTKLLPASINRKRIIVTVRPFVLIDSGTTTNFAAASTPSVIVNGVSGQSILLKAATIDCSVACTGVFSSFCSANVKTAQRINLTAGGLYQFLTLPSGGLLGSDSSSLSVTGPVVPAAGSTTVDVMTTLVPTTKERVTLSINNPAVIDVGLTLFPSIDPFILDSGDIGDMIKRDLFIVSNVPLVVTVLDLYDGGVPAEFVSNEDS